MGQAEVISFDKVRASHHWSQLRQRLHDCFDRWLDTLEPSMASPPTTLAEMTALLWALRQSLMGRLTETLIWHTHEPQARARRAPCPKCQRVLKVRRQASRTVETLVGPVDLQRPYFYCTACRHGCAPLDATLALAAGRYQLGYATSRREVDGGSPV